MRSPLASLSLGTLGHGLLAAEAWLPLCGQRVGVRLSSLFLDRILIHLRFNCLLATS